MKRFTLSAAVVLAVAQILAAAPADAATREVTVRCGQGQKIGRAMKKALKEAGRGDKIKILLRGACKESPTIAADDVIIQSERGRATVEGTINIVGARRVMIKKLRIKGRGPGISVRDGATADIVDNVIENNSRNGIGVSGGSFARVTNNQIRGNGRFPPFTDSGININQAGVRSRGNVIENNGFAAVRVGAFGRFRSGSSLAPGAPLNPSDRDTLIQRGCGRGQSAGSCGAAGAMAVDIFSSGLADLRNGDLTGGAKVDTGSDLQVSESLFNGDIEARGDSAVTLTSSVFGSGGLNCAGGGNSFGSVGCSSSIPPPP